MMTNEPVAALPALESLGGRSPSPELRDDLHVLSGLTGEGQRDLGALVGPCLSETIPASVDGQVQAFAAKHQVPPRDVSRLVRACRFVLRQAAMFNVSPAAFARDVSELAGAETPPALWLIDVFDQARERVRRELLDLSLREHGRVVDTVDWRLDRMEASNRGLSLGVQVATLSLRTRDGDRTERVSFTLPLDVVADLRRACESILALAAPTKPDDSSS